MPTDATDEYPGSVFAVALVSALFFGGATFLALSTLGLPSVEIIVLSGLSGLTVGAFVYRERTLNHSYDRVLYEKNLEISRMEKRILNNFENSVACLAYFDAGTLLIYSVSPGLLQLLRVPADVEVRGKSILDLLHVSSASFEAITSEVQNRRDFAKQYQLDVQDTNGCQLPVEITLNYMEDSHMMEAAILALPHKGPEGAEEIDAARRDLDRFRRGMYRRETRILELKQEVNEVLKSAGRATRYRVDHKTEDKNYPVSKIHGSEEGA